MGVSRKGMDFGVFFLSKYNKLHLFLNDLKIIWLLCNMAFSKNSDRNEKKMGISEALHRSFLRTGTGTAGIDSS
jgi:hypothetical protein